MRLGVIVKLAASRNSDVAKSEPNPFIKITVALIRKMIFKCIIMPVDLEFTVIKILPIYRISPPNSLLLGSA
jgi:hypothetical protein